MSEKIHLRYNCMGAKPVEGKYLHPQEDMERLGITYQHATPQSIADQWWFWNCENLPDKLPDYISAMNTERGRYE